MLVHTHGWLRTDKISMQFYCFATRHEERGRRANDRIPTCLSLDRVHPAGGPYLSNRKPKIRGMRSLCMGNHLCRPSLERRAKDILSFIHRSYICDTHESQCSYKAVESDLPTRRYLPVAPIEPASDSVAAGKL